MTWPPHLPGQFEGEPDRELRAWLRRLPDADLLRLNLGTGDEVARRAFGLDDPDGAPELAELAADMDLPDLADLIRRD